MKLLSQLFEAMEPQKEEDIAAALNQRISDLDFDGVEVTEVSVEESGETVVTFMDLELNEMDVLFSYDKEDGAEAIILEDDDDEFDDDSEVEVDSIDFDALDPKLIDLGDGAKAVDLVNNKWMNRGFIENLFTAGDILDDLSDMDERKAVVVRGGKKVKVSLARRRRKKRLTAKQKAGIRKAVRSRKKKKSQTARKRKKSLKLRKRLKLKKKDNKKFKARG